jgi:ATP-dependent exoDNAse (exonuclease V) alpha subunit
MPIYKLGDYIKYNEQFCTVIGITLNCGIQENLKIEYINFKKKEKETEIISAGKLSLTLIDKDIQPKLISWLKFTDRYNSTINYLNKKKGSGFTSLDSKNAEKDIRLYLFKCKLSFNNLNNIERTLKKTQSFSLQLEKITENAFAFITEEYQIIRFETVDHICDEFNQNIDFEIKCLAWAYDRFLRRYKSFYVLKTTFKKDFEKFCNDYSQDNSIYLPYVEKTIIDIQIDKNTNKKTDKKTYKTTRFMLEKEKKITDLTIDLFNDKKYNISIKKLNKEINNYEILNNLNLEKEQKEAVIKAVCNQCTIITGLPGTGKTTIVKCVLAVLNNLYKTHYDDLNNTYVNPRSIGLIAPTGLAYINMKSSQEKTHYNEKISGTCHRTIYHTFETIKQHKKKKEKKKSCGCKDNVCEYDYSIKLVIADEASMIDINMFNEILDMCKYFKNARLILLGDVNQLESIGPGYVLKSVINSDFFEVTRLTEIKRQGSGELVDCIKKMNNSIIIDSNNFTDDSFEILDINLYIKDGKLSEESIVKLLTDYGYDKNVTKFIAYNKDKKFICNTGSINNILQNYCNPIKITQIIPSNQKFENPYTFRVNDRIVRTENDYTTENMRANGEEAIITDFDGKVVTIRYIHDHINPIEQISIDELYENFILNYCVTIHKSQGSQYSTVIIFIEPGSNLNKSGLYTAISRAKYKCIVIATMKDFINIQNNDTSDKVSLFMRTSIEFESEFEKFTIGEECKTTCPKCSGKKPNNIFECCYNCNQEGNNLKTDKCITCDNRIKPHPRYKTCWKCNHT